MKCSILEKKKVFLSSLLETITNLAHNKSDSPKYGFEALFLTERNQAS